MAKKIRVLMVEDSADDALMVEHELQKGGFLPEVKRVETREQMSRALDEGQWDIIIADYKLPEFSGEDALELLKEKAIDLPFIVVSGTIGEEIAVKMLKNGASDYMVKGKLARLYPAVEREMEESRMRGSRRRTEKELDNANKFMKDILQSISDGFMVLDERMVVLYFNKAAQEMLGRKKEEVVGKNLLEAFPEAKNSVFEEKYKWALQNKQPLFFETYFGVEPYCDWFDVRVYPSQRGISVYFRVITEQKKTERALKESEEKYRMFFESAADLIAIVDPKGKFLDLNRKFEEESKYSRQEMMGKNVFTSGIISKSSVPKTMAAMNKVLRKGESPIVEVEGVTKDGNLVPYELRGIPLKKEGKIIAVQAILRNLTYRKKLKTTQRFAQIGEMMADMAHEIKNPLQVISGRAQIALMEEPGNEEIKGALEIIHDQAQRANELMHKFLYFSKPSKGDYKQVNINESIDYVLSLVEHPFSLKNIKIEKDYVSSPILVEADEKSLHEVFLNLINNSADAMPEGGRLKVKTDVQDNMFRIKIEDTGSGIDEEHMKKLFDPFFTTKEKGTGLGLPLCYNIVKAHGGELSFSSEKGEGTTATILLPLKKS
ncbi:MAG: PAS domain S-box protein [Candidatus Omnitrophica bacterium]|nr:PAS domain S-box protein [Candidatus Omnitrophota bacterium]